MKDCSRSVSSASQEATTDIRHIRFLISPSSTPSVVSSGVQISKDAVDESHIRAIVNDCCKGIIWSACDRKSLDSGFKTLKMGGHDHETGPRGGLLAQKIESRDLRTAFA